MDSATLVERFLAAYVNGWFPMDIDGRIDFYEFDPRAVIPLDGFRVPRSVARALRGAPFEVSVDRAFDEVVSGCGGERHGNVWLTPRLADAYGELHRVGYAHSVEVWSGGTLAGGLFGVVLGGLFTSESMFHRLPDAGNVVLVETHRRLVTGGFTLWDIQMVSDHTRRFGAVEVSPDAYRELLGDALQQTAELA